MNSWIQTRDGGLFRPTLPDANTIEPKTLAVVLSRIPRFGGHTLRPYSVARHSLNVCAIVEDHELKLPALLHDAHEAYSGFGDVCSPMKKLIPQINGVERGIDYVVAERFGFDVKSFYHADVRHADFVMLATEKKFNMANQPAPWVDLPEPLAVLNEGETGKDVDSFSKKLMELCNGESADT